MTRSADKDAARTAALARRAAARKAAGPNEAGLLARFLEAHRGRTLAGYAAMRSEIDPAEALDVAASHGPVGLPVIVAPGQPLRFREWTPGAAMQAGPFGAPVPATGGWLDPEVLVVPLVAFDRHGGRLGYGGGFYDRTLESLRAEREVLAIGFAFAAQEADGIPLEPTDQPLDVIVTEREIIDLA